LVKAVLLILGQKLGQPHQELVLLSPEIGFVDIFQAVREYEPLLLQVDAGVKSQEVLRALRLGPLKILTTKNVQLFRGKVAMRTFQGTGRNEVRKKREKKNTAGLLLVSKDSKNNALGSDLVIYRALGSFVLKCFVTCPAQNKERRGNFEEVGRKDGRKEERKEKKRKKRRKENHPE